MFHLYTPMKRQKTFRLSGGLEMEHWAKMG